MKTKISNKNWARYQRFERLRNKRINPREIYSLDITMINFMLPRLKLYLKKACPMITPYGLESDHWTEIITNIIDGFECYLKASEHLENYEQNYDKFKEGFELFKKYFSNLWW